jgi:hypothetical protein
LWNNKRSQTNKRYAQRKQERTSKDVDRGVCRRNVADVFLAVHCAGVETIMIDEQTTTDEKLDELLAEVRAVRAMLEARNDFARSVFNAIWHGFAEFKKAIEKLYK